MSKHWNTEAMSEILEIYGLPTDKAAEIAEDFAAHLSCMQDMAMDSRGGASRSCAECDKKQRKIDELERELESSEKKAIEWRGDSMRHLGVIKEVYDSPEKAQDILRANNYRER